MGTQEHADQTPGTGSRVEHETDTGDFTITFEMQLPDPSDRNPR